MKKIFVLIYFCFSLLVAFGQGAGIRYVNGIPTAATYTPNLLKKEAVRCYSLTSYKFYYWDNTQGEWFEELLNSQPVSFSDGGGVKRYLNGVHFFSIGDDWEKVMPLVADAQLVPDGKRRWIWGWNQGSNTYHGFGYMQNGSGSESWIFGAVDSDEVGGQVEYNTYGGDENTPTTTGSHGWGAYYDGYYTNRQLLEYQNTLTGGHLQLGFGPDENGATIKNAKLSQADNELQVRDDNYIRANKYDYTRDDGRPESLAWFDRYGVIRRSPIESVTSGINSLNNGVDYAIPYYLNNNLESNDRYIRKNDTTFLKGRSSIIYSGDNLTTLAAALKTGDGIRNIQGNENQSPFTFTSFANEGDGDWLNSANMDLAGFNITNIDGGGDSSPSLRFFSARTDANSLPQLVQKNDNFFDLVAWKHKGLTTSYPIKTNGAGFTFIRGKVDSVYANGNISSSLEFMTEENKGTSAGLSPVRMKIKGNGNVGIGTIIPTAKLEVAGQIKVTGGTPGVGKVLTSDASGLASWQLPSGGSNTDNQRFTKPSAGTLKLSQLGSASDYVYLDSIKNLSISGSNLSISGGNTVTLPSPTPQNLSISGSNLSISGGNTVVLPTGGGTSGVYTPTWVPIAGSAVTAFNISHASYTTIGDLVTVNINCSVAISQGTNRQINYFGITLPVASNVALVSTNKVSGFGNGWDNSSGNPYHRTTVEYNSTTSDVKVQLLPATQTGTYGAFTTVYCQFSFSYFKS